MLLNRAGKMETMTIKNGLAFLFFAFVLINPGHGVGDITQPWEKYFFDGKEFREGLAPSGATVYKREGYLPAILTGNQTIPEDKFPPGIGGLVIFCYIQTAGGKLQNHSGYVPVTGIAIEIINERRTAILRSDGDGYAIIALPAGSYDVRVKGVTRTVRFEQGKTAFMAIRAGKRMVD